MSLESIGSQWIDLFDELCCAPNIKDQIAAPFLSIPAPDMRSVLYVGKATSKDGPGGDAPFGQPYPGDKQARGARIKERREATKKFLEEIAPTYNSGFWQLAGELNVAIAKAYELPAATTLRHITWTNLCKIGALKGNPSGLLFRRQRDLAVETLRVEIELYKPQLIWFATWDYGWDLVKQVFGDSADESWDQTGNEEWFWLRRATDGFPAALLTGHPERKGAQLRSVWLSRAMKFLPA